MKNINKWAWTDEREQINNKMKLTNWDWRGDSKKKDKMLINKMRKKHSFSTPHEKI
jgi:hypothetical protein